MSNTAERRCKATTKAGRPCRVRLINAAGYCVAHDPEKPVDYRALGKKSAEARKRPNPERIHESLRTYLKREVPPERVWQALEAAMLGNNESARVSASRVLMDALAEPDRENKDEEAQTRRANAWALGRLRSLLTDRARSYEVREVRLAMAELLGEVERAVARESPDLIERREPNPEQVAVIFEALEEVGLVAPISRVEEPAQQRLEALKQEHGIPA